MPTFSHLFELHLISLDARRFKAIVTKSTLGSDAESELVLSFWEGDQDWRTTVIKVLESSRGFKAEHFPKPGEQEWMTASGILAVGHPSFASNYLEQIGQQLFQALLRPDQRVGQVFQAALRKAEEAGETLHLRLKFAEHSAQRSRLADYPWELIHDGTRFLLHRRVQLSRYIAYDAVPPKQAIGDRLQVLLVSPRASDIGQLSDAEPEAIRAGIANAESVSLEKLPTPTWRGLSTYLTETANLPQVLHFDGHGIFGKRCQVCGHLHDSTKVETCQSCGAPLPEAQGFLAFEDEQGKAEFVSARKLASLVTDKGIALMVLSACQSGMAVTGESVFNGTAQQLIDADVPAVVAMQYSVRVKEARDFAEQFYRVLGQGETALKALGEGRKWMDVDGNQWYRPVLYLRWRENEAGQLFVKANAEAPAAETATSVSQLLMPNNVPDKPLSVQERLALVQRLNQLPMTQFDELVIALNPPAGVLPTNIAAQGNRTPALLQWVEGPTGPQLSQLQAILTLILHPHARSDHSSAMTETSDTRQGFYQRQIARLEEELAAIGSDIDSAPREVDRLRLEKAAEQLLEKIEKLRAKL
ncbi:CHAT domain-containing protein [Oscillatoria sp. CS-180]|uniref:CHAT domain-containing protein n=1 Tax=Oscillatoria sp. CS-180 TaxID=3021720 RepID=UPI00232EEB05|nr:CHAT domain-containing protein [Oscillatoria sp. CS-180]MDB9526279.1 CHAT domain-containing protein [Oscillatoria sp. CS-180]